MAHEDMNVSVKVLKNKQYVVKAAYRNEKDKKALRPPVGIYLYFRKSGQPAWYENGGLIPISKLSNEAKEWVLDRFTDRKLREVFGGLGD